MGYITTIPLVDYDPDDPPGTPSNETEHPPANQSAGPGLSSAKTSSPPSGSFVQAGSTITYTVTVSNNGETAALNVKVRDPIPAGTEFVSAANNGTVSNGAVRWTIPRIEPGASASVSFTVRVSENIAQANGNIRNLAYVGPPGTPDNPDPPDEPETPSNPTEHYAYRFVKRSDPAAGTAVSPGQQITYYLDVVNIGNTDLDNITVTDVVPPNTTYVSSAPTARVVTKGSKTGLRWDIAKVSAGQTVTVSFVARVNAGNTEYVRNMGYLTTTQPGDYDPDNPPGTPSNEIVHPPIDPPDGPSLSSVKTSSPASGSFVQAGSVITYTVTVSNSGDIAAMNVRVRDPIPAGTELVSAANGGTVSGGAVSWTIPRIDPGMSFSVSFTVRVSENITQANGNIRNVAYVGPPGTPDNPEPPDGPETPTTPTEHYAYRFVKRSSPAAGTAVSPGQRITYYLDVVNLGNRELRNITVTDVVPASTAYVSSAPAAQVVNKGSKTGLRWDIALVNAGQTVTVSFVAQVRNGNAAYVRNVGYITTTPPGTYDPDYPPGNPSNPVEHPPAPVYNPTPTPTPTPYNPTPTPYSPYNPTPTPYSPYNPTPTPYSPYSPTPTPYNPANPTPPAPTQGPANPPAQPPGETPTDPYTPPEAPYTPPDAPYTPETVPEAPQESYYVPGGIIQSDPPAPSDPSHTLTPLEDGRYLELDEDGTPLGTWRWDDDEGEWIFDDEIPFGTPDTPEKRNPTTGDPFVLILELLGVSLVFMGGLIITYIQLRSKIKGAL
jgi:uncharacterized repeat protein (TIGR01451 family)